MSRYGLGIVNLHAADWAILVALFLVPLVVGWRCRPYAHGIAGFLVAGRSVGRYLGLGSDSMQAVGAVTILAYWQMNYQAGFAGQWWYFLTPVAGMLVALTGWGIYRFRETRAMTLGELVGLRYGRGARMFFGLIAFLAGVLNMGIFPAVGAGFFIYYCGLPEQLSVAGLLLPTSLGVMVLFVGTAVMLCFWGGQVTLIVTDFVQSVFINAMLIGTMVALSRLFTWDQVVAAYASVSNTDALLHPFRGEGASAFDQRFFLIHVYYWMVYSVLSWSPNSMLVASARDAHEAKMMRVMLHGRNLAMMGLGMLILPLAAFVLLHHPDFAREATAVGAAVDGIANTQVRSQMITPAAVVRMLPIGLAGAFAGVVLYSFITTHDSYLLAWGGLLIQDVVIPWRGRPLSPRAHLLWLRGAVIGVAVFIVAFSALFQQVDNIFMFMDISASLYTGGAGVVLLGALYWPRATRTAAWATMIVGATLSAAGFVWRSLDPAFLDGRIMAFWISLICIGLFVGVSLAGSDPRFDLAGMLHRDPERRRPWWVFDEAVPRADRTLIPALFAGLGLFLVLFVGVGLYNVVVDVPVSSWTTFWHGYVYVMFGAGSAFLVWISVGGFRDVRRLVAMLGNGEKPL